MSESDLTLAQRGDPAAFERLVSPHLKGLYGFILKRTQNQAEDVYEESLLAAWRAIKGFQRGSTVKTWLYAIAGYKCTDAIRKNASSPAFKELDETQAVPGFEDDSVTAMDLRTALSHTSDDDQALLHLIFHEGFTQKEAGDLLGIPEGTVKSRLNRLKKQLKLSLTGGVPHDA